MSYAIFRVETINKLSDLAQIGSHNKREKKTYKSNPDIDITKTKNNIELVPLSEKYIKGFYNLTKEYKKEYDKRTNTEKYTISKKQYIKDKAHLSGLQDKYYQRLIDKGFDLERGIKNSDNEHISIKEFKKTTRKLDNRLEQQNYLMTRGFEELQEKLKTSKPTITGKEVKIDKDTYDTLNNFMNTSKRVIKDIPRNQALFKELADYTQSYKDLENEKRNIQYEVKRLEYKNKELQQENNKLKSLSKS